MTLHAATWVADIFVPLTGWFDSLEALLAAVGVAVVTPKRGRVAFFLAIQRAPEGPDALTSSATRASATLLAVAGSTHQVRVAPSSRSDARACQLGLVLSPSAEVAAFDAELAVELLSGR